MKFIEVTPADGAGTMLINVDDIVAVVSVDGGTKIFLRRGGLNSLGVEESPAEIGEILDGQKPGLIEV